MKILIHLAHPAHYHLFKNVAVKLMESNDVHISYNEKDVLDKIIDATSVPASWYRLNVKGGKIGKWTFLRQFVEKEVGLFRLAYRLKPDVLVGTPIVLAHVGKLLGIPSIIVNEDDFDVISTSTSIGYPFASVIAAPSSCSHGRFGHKTVHYEGYHELAYLSPKYFIPDEAVIKKYVSDNGRYFVLRFSSLTAHHDVGKSGISEELAWDIVELLKRYGRVIINAEKHLDDRFDKYIMPIDPRDIHHVMYYADLYLGDSQTMAAEAAVMGTPSVRYNDFVGKLGYLEELETVYGLTKGIPMGNVKQLKQLVENIVSEPDYKNRMREKAYKMYNQKVDVAQWMADFIVNFSRCRSNIVVPD